MTRPLRIRSRVYDAYVAALPEYRLRKYIGEGASIRSFTPHHERAFLFDQATRVLVAPAARGRFLEVGSHLGASAVVLAEVLRRDGFDDGQVYCIDTWRNDAMTEGPLDTFAEFTANTRPWASLITPIRASSIDAQIPDEGPFDLAFIDGDHSFEAATADIARFAPLVAPHGRLILHDHCSKPGVNQALGNLLCESDWVIAGVMGSMLALRRANWAMPS